MFEYTISYATLEHNYISYSYLRSELTLIIALLMFLLIDILVKNQKKSFLINTLLFATAVVLTMYFSISEFTNHLYGPTGVFFTDFKLYFNGEIEQYGSSMLTLTKQGSFFKFLMSICALLLLVFNHLEFKVSHSKETKVEYLISITAILLGSFLLVSATHFLSLLLAIEISSFGAYALIYFNGDVKSKEASIKYILYGFVATGIMVFGMSILYALLGDLSYNALISNCMTENNLPPALSLGIMFMCMGLFFKLAIVPMYFWVPDTFQGGPMSGIAFLSLVPKFGALGNFILLFSYIYVSKIYDVTIQDILLVLGVFTATIGNFFALGQTNIKRLLGYSSIAHSGFLLIAVAIMGTSGLNSVLFYALVYVFMNFLCFMTSEYFSSLSNSYNIKQWAGLGNGAVFMGVLLILSLASLIGLPPTAGFSAKLFVFSGLIELYTSSNSSLILFVLILALFNILISLFYYLKIPFYLFFQKSSQLIPDNTTLLPKLQMVLVAIPLIALFLFSEKTLVVINSINDIVKYFVQ